MSYFLQFAVRSAACIALLLSLATASSAAIINLTIDSTQSSLSLAGSVSGILYNPQAAGALTTSLSGTLTGSLNAGVMSFSPGSSIVVNANPSAGSFTVAPNPAVLLAPLNFGVTGAGVLPFPFGNVNVNGVYRNLNLDLTAGSATNGAAMIGGMLQFQAGGQLVFGITTSAGVSNGASNINTAASNTSAGPVSWTTNTLTVPVAFATTGANGRIENWSGVIVAHGVVPEPSSLALLGLGGLSALIRRRRVAS